MFEEFQRQEEIIVIKALEKVKEYCNFHQNHNKGCERCMLYDENKKSCLAVQQKKIPKEWELLIKVEV